MNRYQKLKRAIFQRQPIGLIVFAAVLALAAYPAWHVWAAPGDLDTSFSGDGRWSDITSFSRTRIADLAIQVDTSNPTVEKIIVPLTDADADKPVQILSARFRVKRLHPSGAIDSSFGNNGTTDINFNDYVPYPDWGAEITAIELQPNGKILVAGTLHHGLSDQSLMVVARLTFDGALDPTFDGDGRWVFLGHAEVADMALQSSNGKIVLAGRWKSGAAASWKSALWRLNSNGSLDTSFSGDGLYEFIVAPGNADDDFGFKSVGVQSDGKIVAMSSNSVYRLRRVTSSGLLDSTLNVNAVSGEGGNTIKVLGSSIWIVGYKTIQNVGYGAVFARLSSNGLVDTSFGNSGKIVSSQASTWRDAASVPFSFPSKWVIVGKNEYPNCDWRAVLTRYSGSGVLDTTFGTNGSTETVGFQDYNGNAIPLAEYTTVRIGLSGKIVAGGMGGDQFLFCNITSFFAAVARYWNN